MSGAASMRNSVKRITHKERSQPAARKKFGLLEKHKDYVERAQDYKKKKTVIKNLKKKASEKNPDEFYYKMNSSRVTKDGIHKDIVDGTLNHDTVKLLKSQDMGYVVHKKCVDARKIEKLKENLHLIGSKPVKNHTIFVDNTADVEAFDAAAHFDTPAELVHATSHNRLKHSQLEELANQADVVSRSSAQLKAIKEKNLQTMERSYNELYERNKRAKKLNSVMDKLQLQRNLMNSKGTKIRMVKQADGTVLSGKESMNTNRRDEFYRRKSKRGSTDISDRNTGDVVIYKWKKQRSK